MVKRYYFVCLFIIVLGMQSITFGQIAKDLDFIMAHNPIETVKGKESSLFTFNETNELKTAIMGLIRVYQLFISTQDKPACNFTPSCSRFGMAAFKEYGIFYGTLMTFDRLQRCHGMGRRYYSIQGETEKSYDPVEHNLLWNK